jgi:transposase
MSEKEVVAAYKGLSVVEQAFRTLKTVALEIRPVYHRLDERIRSHVFLCVLAYYLQWHVQQRLQPLFDSDGEGKNRQWTMENALERLKGIRRERVKMAEVEFDHVTQADEEQQRILDLLKIKL